MDAETFIQNITRKDQIIRAYQEHDCREAEIGKRDDCERFESLERAAVGENQSCQVEQCEWHCPLGGKEAPGFGLVRLRQCRGECEQRKKQHGNRHSSENVRQPPYSAPANDSREQQRSKQNSIQGEEPYVWGTEQHRR